MGRSGRSAPGSGWAGSGKIECKNNYSPRKLKSTVISKAFETGCFNVFLGARTRDFLCQPTEEQNQRLTTNLSAVYQQDEKTTLLLAAEQLNDRFCLCRPFSCQACLGKTFESKIMTNQQCQSARTLGWRIPTGQGRRQHSATTKHGGKPRMTRITSRF